MIELTDYLFEALQKKEFYDIIKNYKNAKLVDDLSQYYEDLHVSKSRRKELDSVITKSIGSGPYYIVGYEEMDDMVPSERKAKEAITQLFDKAVLTGSGRDHLTAKTRSERKSVIIDIDDYMKNYGFNNIKKLKEWIKDEHESPIRAKDRLEKAIRNNEKFKELGLTDELNDQLQKMTSAFDFKPIKFDKNISVKGIIKKDEQGNSYGGGTLYLDVIPSVILISGKLIKVLNLWAASGRVDRFGYQTYIIPKKDIDAIED